MISIVAMIVSSKSANEPTQGGTAGDDLKKLEPRRRAHSEKGRIARPEIEVYNATTAARARHKLCAKNNVHAKIIGMRTERTSGPMSGPLC